MPHLSGVEINALASTAGYRLAAKGGLAMVNSLLSQLPGNLGYTLENKGEIWESYVAVGDSYDAAHGFFGGTYYTLAIAAQTIPVLGALLPVDDDDLLPGDDEDPPVDDDDEPVKLGGDLGFGLTGLGAAVEIVSWFGDLLSNLQADSPQALGGLSRNTQDGINSTEQNAVVRILGGRNK